MKEELEVKILGVDISILERLENLKAKKVSEEEQTNYILTSNFDNIGKDNYLRVRKVKAKDDTFTEITLKKLISDQIVRKYEEYTVKTKDTESALDLMKNLGFSISHIGYKKRISYKLGGIRFDYDIWDKDTYPEAYLEIEVEHKEQLDEILNKLNIDEQMVTTLSISQLKKRLGN